MSTLIQTIKDLDSSINSKKVMLKNTINTSVPGTIIEEIPSFGKINEAISKIDFGLSPVFEMITTNKQWTCPSNIASNVSVRVFGGGGKGADGESYINRKEPGSGGGGGHMSYKILSISAGTTVSCTIGAGGDSIDSLDSAASGSSTSFGSYVSAAGGSGGKTPSWPNGGTMAGGTGGSGGGGGANKSTGGVGGTATYGGQGGNGGSTGSSTSGGISGINTTALGNRFMMLGSASGGQRNSISNYPCGGGGGGGYGSTGGSVANVDEYIIVGGGGGGGYGGRGGNGKYDTYETGVGTGYACGGGGGTGNDNATGNGAPGTQGCILISYLVKVKKENILPI